MKLANARKAGTISNQKSAAATAWLTLNAASDFRAFGMAWTGYYSVLSSNIFSWWLVDESLNHNAIPGMVIAEKKCIQAEYDNK